MRAALALLALALGADPRARLGELRARKAAEEAAAHALAEREGSLLAALDAAEQGWLASSAAAAEAEAERAAAELRLARARAEEAQAQARLQALQGELGPRLRARARQDRLTELRLLASAGSLAELVKRRYLWEQITRHDLVLLAEAQRAADARERARASREEETARVATLARRARARHEEATARREEHRALLAAVRGARALHERAAAEAAGQEAKLAEFVAALPPPNGAPLHTGFAQLRGRLPRPAAGPVEQGFGRVVDPRWGTVTVQNGVDIRAPAGAEVRAVAPGRVAHAGWFKGYGNLVILDHGDGFHSLVAHLASMSTAMGEEVEAGALLGTVGDTGSLKGPLLYFEIRERGRPVDPAAWLRP